MNEQGDRLKFSQIFRLGLAVPWIGLRILSKSPHFLKHVKILKRLKTLFQDAGKSTHLAGVCIPIHSIISQSFDSPKFVELAPDFQTYIQDFECTIVYRQVKLFLAGGTVLPEFSTWLSKLEEEDFFESQALGSLKLQVEYCREREELAHVVPELESFIDSIHIHKRYSEGEA